jgi:hypothetical protein
VDPRENEAQLIAEPGLVVRFRSSPALAARSDTNFGI